MKRIIILSLTLLSLLTTSCKKKETTPEETPTTTGSPTLTYLIGKDSVPTVTSGTVTTDGLVRKFEYNSAKKLVRVWYKSGTNVTYNSRDTVYYNGSGQVSKVERYHTGSSTVQESKIYNYTSGVLASVNETGTNSNGAYVRTRIFSYTSGVLSAQTVTYTSGSSDGGGVDNFTSAVFSNGNLVALNITGVGAVTATYATTAPNPYYGLNYDPEDLINMFCSHNILQAYPNSNPTSYFVDNTYTYLNGRVATISDASETPIRVTTISYVGL